ncbi:probable LRR receptor-like serine/threonine-protein kinase At3g47570 [Solanum tuberosum]|nr:PREDICTED: probable LRR receptor-like serine/threonine-protein kinase At3g47570 [Solanum tuberosum]
MSSLLYLSVSQNSIEGEVPSDIGGLKAIVELYLYSNHFSGMIPSTFGELQNLQYLDLSNNSFFGQIPLSFANLISLDYLNLSLNALSGTIPKSLEKLAYLKSINVSFNDLEGEIPSGVFENSTLQSFLGNKGLCGMHILEIPACAITNPRKQSKLKEVVLKIVTPVVIASFLIFLFVSIWIMKRQRKGCEGSSGSVYKGTLFGGTAVAIKVLDLENEQVCKRFDTECEVMRNVRHINLVSVITTCSNDYIRAFVLQFMPNGSLENWLYKEDRHLNLHQRVTVMLDAAMAVEYLLHAGAYIGGGHRVHMEVLTKRRPTEEEICNGNLDLRKWITQSFSGSMMDVVDANLFCEEEQTTSKSEMCIASMIELALDCTKEAPQSRVTMKEVVKRLNKIKNAFLET